MNKAIKKNYQSLKAELDEVMLELQTDNLDVDKSLELYERGLELVRAVEKYLIESENKITELKAKFDSTQK